MSSCNHATLELVPQRRATVRCRRCNLTLSADELGDGYCPECFDAKGIKNYEFESIASNGSKTIYRCEECGAVIEL